LEFVPDMRIRLIPVSHFVFANQLIEASYHGRQGFGAHAIPNQKSPAVDPGKTFDALQGNTFSEARKRNRIVSSRVSSCRFLIGRGA